ncbi:MAG: hypothetical protein HRU09_05435 [Oligoflexales bacterium]|nr:hypothetical protein [Oligoflexales bacterium]
MFSYEVQNAEYNRIKQMYLDYLKLYKFFNHGSTKGCTGFAQFYWMHSYHHKSANLLKQLGITR